MVKLRPAGHMQPFKVYLRPLWQTLGKYFHVFDIKSQENTLILYNFWAKIQKTSPNFLFKFFCGLQCYFPCKFGPWAKKPGHPCHIAYMSYKFDLSCTEKTTHCDHFCAKSTLITLIEKNDMKINLYFRWPLNNVFKSGWKHK